MIILLGMMLFMASMGAGILAIFGMIPPMVYIAISIATGFIGGMIILLIGMLCKGIIAPMLSARMGGKTLVAILTANKNIDLEAGKENDGIVDTKRGSFIMPTDTVYSWPNGVRSGLAFYKYGVTLKPEHIKACSVLKKNDINDINQLEKAEEKARKSGSSMIIDTKEVIE